MKSIPGTRVWIVAAVVWMLIVFTTQYFSQVPGQQPRFQIDSDSLVNLKIEAGLGVIEEFRQVGGFLHYVGTVYWQDPDSTETGTLPYLSQAGIQGTVAHLVYQLFRPFMSADTFLSLLRIANAFAFVGLIFVLAAHVVRDYGRMAVGLVGFMTVFFVWTTNFSLSVYWVIWTHFLPFAASFLLFPRVLNGKMSHRVFYAVIALMVMFKALSGYEYLTNVIGAASIPIVYYGIREKMSLRGIVVRIIGIGIAGGVGFSVALALHLIQGALFYGSLTQVIERLRSRAARTVIESPATCFQGNIAQLAYEYMFRPVLPAAIPSSVLLLHIIALVQIGLIFSPTRSSQVIRLLLSIAARGELLIIAGLVTTATLVLYLVAGGGESWTILLTLAGSTNILMLAFVLVKPGVALTEHVQQVNLRALALSTAFSIPVSWTWLLFGSGHMACHLHIDSIVFFIPFGFMFAYLTAALLTTWSRRAVPEDSP